MKWEYIYIYMHYIEPLIWKKFCFFLGGYHVHILVFHSPLWFPSQCGGVAERTGGWVIAGGLPMNYVSMSRIPKDVLASVAGKCFCRFVKLVTDIIQQHLNQIPGTWSLNPIVRCRGPSKQVGHVFKCIWGVFTLNLHVTMNKIIVQSIRSK